MSVNVAIGASGVVGIALETTEGVYAPPSKFIPILDESMQWVQETVWRRPIRGVADIVGAAQGNARAEGDVRFEVYDDVLPYFLQAARVQTTKTGASPNFIYTFKPTAAATPNRTISLTVVRNDQVFGYLGCVVGSMEFSVEDGLLVCSMRMVGRDEASQDMPDPVVFESDEIFGAGMYDVRIPESAGSPDTTLDNFSLRMENNPDPQYRLNPTGPGARYIAYGERSVEVSVDRDFESRAEFTEFRQLTAKSIQIRAQRAANRAVQFNVRSAIVDTYEVGLSGQGDLVRGSVSYQGVWNDPEQEALQIQVETDEDVPVA